MWPCYLSCNSLETGRFASLYINAYGVDISEPESDPEPEPEPTLIVRAKRGRPSKADKEARKTLSTTTTTTPNRAPKKSKILKNINN